MSHSTNWIITVTHTTHPYNNKSNRLLKWPRPWSNRGIEREEYIVNMFSIWIRYTNNSIEVTCFSHLCRIESRYPRKLENAEEGNENLHSLLRHASYFLLLNRHRCSLVYKYKRLVYHNPLQCRTTELTSRNRNLLIVKFVIYGGIRKAIVSPTTERPIILSTWNINRCDLIGIFAYQLSR